MSFLKPWLILELLLLQHVILVTVASHFTADSRQIFLRLSICWCEASARLEKLMRRCHLAHHSSLHNGVPARTVLLPNAALPCIE